MLTQGVTTEITNTTAAARSICARRPNARQGSEETPRVSVVDRAAIRVTVPQR
jgi:hypothetical protein